MLNPPIKDLSLTVTKYMKAILYLPAVQTAKTSCRESKNKNMMRRESEAPSGRNMAWYESKVETSAKRKS